MNQLPSSTTEQDETARTVVLICYVLGGVGIFTAALPTLIALIVAYIKRPESRGTMFESHYDWLIFTFWVGIVGTVVSSLTGWILGLGFLIYAVLSLWLLYRFVKGVLRLLEKRAVV